MIFHTQLIELGALELKCVCANNQTLTRVEWGTGGPTKKILYRTP